MNLFIQVIITILLLWRIYHIVSNKLLTNTTELNIWLWVFLGNIASIFQRFILIRNRRILLLIGIFILFLGVSIYRKLVNYMES